MPQPSRSTRTQSQPGPRPLRVLVVDHEPQARKALVECLPTATTSAAPRIALTEAKTLAEARERLAQGPVDILVVEPNLPDGSGLAFAEQIRKARPATQTIILTEHPTAARAIAALRAGASDLLTKPIKCDEARERLAQALARHRSSHQVHQRIARLRRICRKLSLARDQVTQQVDILCNDLVTAYQELANQMQEAVQSTEFTTLIREELDLEQLLRKSLEYLLQKAGPTNAALFLPTNGDEYSLGGYVNYECSSGSADVLLQHLADVTAPRVAGHEGVLHITDNAALGQWIGDDAAYLEDAHVLAFRCVHEGETLAVVILFRDHSEPFEDVTVDLCRVLAPRLAQALGKLIRIHHRHLGDTHPSTGE